MTPSDTSALAKLDIERNASVHVLHPKQIAAFRGASSQRKDRLLALGDMYRKKKWLESVVEGPAELWIGLPRGFSYSTLEIGTESSLLFLFRNVLHYPAGMTMSTTWLPVRKALAAGDLMRVRFAGPGTIGLVSSGPLVEVELHPTEPAFVDVRSLVAFPKECSLRLAVYGNSLASQHMPYQWQMTGTGSALVQSCVPNARLEAETDHDSFFRRVLREIVPFGGVLFK
ncbi:AIM24 family protein [Paenibacillus antri]|uniref:AIM24 family protein n=1 Tax=Paenibacillus antri TaxID=2582848 RepID=A0A5R9GFJ9_9BACL|nr:AIM24 family protein [Paenibacillus antri]TLS53959.1 AIM24 family protein [Paenibacillus antri]